MLFATRSSAPAGRSRKGHRGSQRAPWETLEARAYFAAITGAVLYNADTGQPIGPFENNTTINYAALPTHNLSVRATVGGIGSVVFGLDGNASLTTENFAPYSVVGDANDGKPNPWTPSNGAHTLTITAFSGEDGSGGAVDAPLTITFNVSGGGAGSVGGGTQGSSPVVSFSDVFADASEAKLDPGTLVISRTGSTAKDLSISYNVGGTATNGADYVALPGFIIIPAGKSSANLVITPKEDGIAEGTESIDLTINLGNGYTVGSPAAANVPILDNDAVTTPTPTPTTPTPTPTTPTPTPTSTQSVSDVKWSTNGARAPIERTEPGAIQIGNKLYMIGGFTAGTSDFYPLTHRVDVYDASTGKYTQLASMPSAAAGNHSGIATDGNDIYVVAGQTGDTYGVGTNTTWKYNIASNKWSQFVSLPAVRFGGGAFIANGWLHFAAGDASDRSTDTTDHWAINLSDPSSGWIRKASVPIAGDHLSHVEINGKFYFVGGEQGHHGLGPNASATYIQHDYLFEYDADSDTWTRKADMPEGVSHAEGTTLIINNKIVVIGGLLDGGDTHASTKVQVYDPATDKWKVLPTQFPVRKYGASAIYWNGKIYLTNGFSPDVKDRQIGYVGTASFT